MSRSEALRSLIADLVVAASRRRREEISKTQARMAEELHRRARFDTRVAHWREAVILPRLQETAKLVDDAVCDVTDPVTDPMLTFNRSRKVPATVTLHFALDLDDEGRVKVLCLPTILPILMKFTQHDEFVLPMEKVTDEALAGFVEHCIIRFVEDWLRLLRTPAYRRDNLVVDPVCGMKVDRWNPVATTERAGQTWIFCSHACRARFERDANPPPPGKEFRP